VHVQWPTVVHFSAAKCALIGVLFHCCFRYTPQLYVGCIIRIQPYSLDKSPGEKIIRCMESILPHNLVGMPMESIFWSSVYSNLDVGAPYGATTEQTVWPRVC